MENRNIEVQKPFNIPKLILTRQEACKYLCVSPRLLDEWRMREVDPLPYFKGNKKILFSLPLVDEWFRRQITRGESV